VNLKILHTADWHIGQLFHEYDRTNEHQQFLNWLLKAIPSENIDVLLISGDVFDLSNPSAASVKMFYSFLNRAVRAAPALQIVVTAGNHDSASRLESPKPLLESSNIHIVGLIEKSATEGINYNKIIIPLKSKDGETRAWCIAAPFLRIGDYPVIPDAVNTYSDGIAAFYREAYEYAASLRQPGQAIIAMGHLHALQAETSDEDLTERPIMGGVESIPASAFDEHISYVALGHIHNAQRVGGREHIRYSGSPLPMSFSEISYKHQVVVFEVRKDKIENLRSIEIPVSTPLMRIPSVHSSLTEVIDALMQLDESKGKTDSAPYLEVRVLLDGPEPGLRHKIETVLAGKNVRLARIDPRYKSAAVAPGEMATVSPGELNDPQPEDVLQKVYQSKYNSLLPEDLMKLFRQAVREVNEMEA
jgi:exonuclease SbcD